MDIDVTIEPATNIEVEVAPSATIDVEVAAGRPGIPPGGDTDQVLKKNSSTDYDASWQDDTGGGGSSAWGGITGTLSDQTDLQAALDEKVESTTVATLWTGTQTAYDAIAVKDANTLYVITG